jgi:phospholipid/cholesterol/gamma-HCH transport system substrate-binding protein
MSQPITQGMLSRRVRIAQIVLIVIAIVGALLVGNLVLSGPLFSSPYRLQVDLASAAGLHKKSDVSYRGQHIGTVTRVELTPTGVRATLTINEGVRVPRDTEVVVANLSAVGEQYLDFRPRTDKGPWLADGDVIAVEQTTLPLPISTVINHAQMLLDRVNPDDLEILNTEFNALLEGQELDLRGLGSEVNRSVRTLTELQPKLLELAKSGRRPLQAFSDLSPQLRRLAKNSVTITAALREAGPEFTRAIDAGATVVPLTIDTVGQLEPDLDRTLKALAPLSKMSAEHLPGLRHWYKWGPRQMVAMAESTRNGSGHVILVLSPARPCYYRDINLSPYDGRDPPADLGTRCPTNAPYNQQRGADKVPIP